MDVGEAGGAAGDEDAAGADDAGVAGDAGRAALAGVTIMKLYCQSCWPPSWRLLLPDVPPLQRRQSLVFWLEVGRLLFGAFLFWLETWHLHFGALHRPERQLYFGTFVFRLDAWFFFYVKRQQRGLLLFFFFHRGLGFAFWHWVSCFHCRSSPFPPAHVCLHFDDPKRPACEV